MPNAFFGQDCKSVPHANYYNLSTGPKESALTEKRAKTNVVVTEC